MFFKKFFGYFMGFDDLAVGDGAWPQLSYFMRAVNFFRKAERRKSAVSRFPSIGQRPILIADYVCSVPYCVMDRFQMNNDKFFSEFIFGVIKPVFSYHNGRAGIFEFHY